MKSQDNSVDFRQLIIKQEMLFEKKLREADQTITRLLQEVDAVNLKLATLKKKP